MPDDLESDIQATAEDIAADADVLQAIEAEKAATRPDRPPRPRARRDRPRAGARHRHEDRRRTRARRRGRRGPTPEPSES